MTIYRRFAHALNALEVTKASDHDVRRAIVAMPDVARRHRLGPDFVTDARAHILVETRWADLYAGRIPGWQAHRWGLAVRVAY